MLRHGWRTAAIVPELEQETQVVSTKRYALSLTWLQALTGLMERLQVRSQSPLLCFYTGALQKNSNATHENASLDQLQPKMWKGLNGTDFDIASTYSFLVSLILPNELLANHLSALTLICSFLSLV